MFTLRNKIILLILLLFFTVHLPAIANTINELESNIQERNSEIRELEEEISELGGQIDLVGAEAKTLENALKQLNLTDRKLTTDTRLTRQKITGTGLAIEELALGIIDKEQQIQIGGAALAQSLRNIHELESRSFIEIIFSQDGFSGFWNSVQGLQQFQGEVNGRVHSLQALKREFEGSKKASEREQKNLIAYNVRLGDQQEIVKQNKDVKNILLKETKNKESNYKELLNERLARREALEQELRDFEAQLRVEIDPKSLPRPGEGVLRWPIDSVKVTQYFGNTPFASKNPQVYNGAGHNGIDLRAAPGTVIKNAANGVVVDTGNTDTVHGCYSYGKWVLIRHYNGLATLYAHLSLIRATPGQEVSTGDIIGYSGNTGYSTGPHLHLGVYAANAVRVVKLGDIKEITNCGAAHIPVSPPNGYLNPLSYF